MKPFRTLLPLLLCSTLIAAASTSPLAAKMLSTPEELLRYLANHRADASLVSYSVARDGGVDPTGPEILLNPDQPMPLGSTIKIVVLAAYAREVAGGRLDPETRVSLLEWERYYLPGTDGNAHAFALADLGLAADKYGFVLDSTQQVSLDAVVRAMIHFSDNTATDLLIATVGASRIAETIEAAGLAGQEMPLPILGVFLSWENHDDGPLTQGRVRELLAMDHAAYLERVAELTGRFQNLTWRLLEYLWMLNGQSATPRLEARVADRWFPRGTARDYARIMAGVVTRTFLSPEISAIMRRHLGAIIEVPEIGELFVEAGYKGGSLFGVGTTAWYLVPRTGDFEGERRVAVLFLRRLPMWAWNRLNETGADQLFDLRLGLDRDFAEEAREKLAP